MHLIFADHGNKSPPGMNTSNPLSALEMTRLALFKMYNQAGLPHVNSGPPVPPTGPLGAGVGINQASLEMGRAMVEQQARMIQAAQQEAEAREKEYNSKSPVLINESNRLSQPKDQNTENNKQFSERSKESCKKSHCEEEEYLSSPPMKRERQDSSEHRSGSPLGMGANIRIANRGIFL